MSWNSADILDCVPISYHCAVCHRISVQMCKKITADFVAIFETIFFKRKYNLIIDTVTCACTFTCNCNK